MKSNLKLIIGLGNPDSEYQETRHNIGFMALDFLARKYGLEKFSSQPKLLSHAAKGEIEKTSVIFAKPTTFVNKSGDAVSKLKNFYKTKPEDNIVFQDDLDIEFGKVKLSFEKNSGGHKGVESIMKSLKTKKFYRIRLGISVKSLQKARQLSEKKRDEFVRDFVLSKFSKKENETLKQVFKEAEIRLLQII